MARNPHPKAPHRLVFQRAKELAKRAHGYEGEEQFTTEHRSEAFRRVRSAVLRFAKDAESTGYASDSEV